MRREDAFRRVALGRLRDDLQGIRVWLYHLAVLWVISALVADGEPVWKRLVAGVAGVGLFGVARGIYQARAWARYVAAALCLGPMAMDVARIVLGLGARISLFDPLFLGFGIYLLLPRTGERFRRAQPGT